MAKAGIVEALYVGEFVGLLIIWAGFQVCVKAGARQPVASSAGSMGASPASQGAG